MKQPKMILFDYGETLIHEQAFDGVCGTKAVMQYAVRNRHNHTAEEIQAAADEINRLTGRFDPNRKHLCEIEVPNEMFTSYLYQSMGIELSLTPKEIDRIFWDAASPGTLTDGIADFLLYLKRAGIRTGVISNISYAGDVVKERIHRLLPENDFAFILPSSEYLFRKPNPRIFTLALEKADLPPEDVWYIGDNYECDVVGSRNAGLFPLWYTGAIRPKETYIERAGAEHVTTVSHWNEVKRMIDAL